MVLSCKSSISRKGKPTWHDLQELGRFGSDDPSAVEFGDEANRIGVKESKNWKRGVPQGESEKLSGAANRETHTSRPRGAGDPNS